MRFRTEAVSPNKKDINAYKMIPIISLSLGERGPRGEYGMFTPTLALPRQGGGEMG